MTPQTEAVARELLPCPFCGTPPVHTETLISRKPCVICVHHGCPILHLEFDATRWNTRAQPAATGNGVREYGLDFAILRSGADFQVWTPDAGGACIGSGATKIEAIKNACDNLLRTRSDLLEQ